MDCRSVRADARRAAAGGRGRGRPLRPPPRVRDRRRRFHRRVRGLRSVGSCRSARSRPKPAGRRRCVAGAGQSGAPQCVLRSATTRSRDRHLVRIHRHHRGVGPGRGRLSDRPRLVALRVLYQRSPGGGGVGLDVSLRSGKSRRIVRGPDRLARRSSRRDGSGWRRLRVDRSAIRRLEQPDGMGLVGAWSVRPGSVPRGRMASSRTHVAAALVSFG